MATDQNGSPLSYSFSSGGSNVTVYTLGATEVTLRYDTDNLTAKAGTVWSLAFDSGYNSTVIVPQLSTLVSVSGTPYTINQTDDSPELTLSVGRWNVTYGVPFTVGSNTTTVTSSGMTSTMQGGGAAVVDLQQRPGPFRQGLITCNCQMAGLEAAQSGVGLAVALHPAVLHE